MPVAVNVQVPGWTVKYTYEESLPASLRPLTPPVAEPPLKTVVPFALMTGWEPP
ncbi:hypothetical protein [Streptomyces sp. CA-179760]|uniref:hypothetical protein n=1 Tax=Streptomyces sp. CA-179760 TaxID=3240054 RepID=UPI003D93953F